MSENGKIWKYVAIEEKYWLQLKRHAEKNKQSIAGFLIKALIDCGAVEEHGAES